MALEIERKYLVHPKLWDALKKPDGNRITQSYLSFTPERTVRVRIKNTSAFITIKGKTEGISRLEYEYPIPVSLFSCVCTKSVRITPMRWCLITIGRPVCLVRT